MKPHYEEIKRLAEKHFTGSNKTETHSDVCEFLDTINGGLSNGKDFIINFDQITNVLGGIGEDVMVSYWSDKLKKMIVLTTMARTSFDSVHELVEELESYNMEAQAIEKSISINK